MILTRCPACETVFRVRTEQLKQRSGRVRCGRCGTAFNALDTLIEENATEQQNDLFARLTRRGSADNPPPALEEPAAPSAPEAPDLWAPQDVLRAAPAAPRAELDIPPTPPEPPGHDSGEPSPTAAAALPPDPFLAFGEPRLDEPAPESLQVKAPPEATPAVPDAPARPKSSGLVWGTGALVLAVLLTAQLAYWYRSELANSVPALRPALTAMCQQLDCDIPLPRKADLISIEASDLHPEPGTLDTLVLNATLKNRATFTQAYPALELTLTDAQEKAVSRRVLFPNDYLPAKASPDQGIPENGDLAVQLRVQTRGIAAVGYKLYVFYP